MNKFPEIGEGVTIRAYTDCYAGTIAGIEKKNNRLYITVKEDIAVRTDHNGMSNEGQEYSYTPNENGRVFVFRQKGNAWVEQGRPSNGYVAEVGYRKKFHDFCF